jgi:hypothetical protein
MAAITSIVHINPAALFTWRPSGLVDALFCRRRIKRVKNVHAFHSDSCHADTNVGSLGDVKVDVGRAR